MRTFSRLFKNKGFTLLEIIIVIIILGILASLAVPQFFQMTEGSRSSEALPIIDQTRGSLERCFIMGGQSYATCGAYANLDVADPGTNPQGHFTYAITTSASSIYTIVATRRTVRGGAVGSTITFIVTPTGVTRSGTSAFSGIQ